MSSSSNIDGILYVWRGRIGEYHLNSEKLGFNMDRRPKAGGPYWTPISKDEDGIPQYVRARLTVLTLLLSILEATKYAKMDLELSFDRFLCTL